MPVETGNLMRCVQRAGHHADWTKFMQPLKGYDKLRIVSIEDALKKINEGLIKIENAAEAGDISAIRAVLRQEFSFGKDKVDR